ncbi:hypothetical protein DACRYDRAFT_119062 [Dacryopinax primogenitus]|uniref:ER membrane protein complex subunit 7 beta-sandwich domain-containing protein n=1 Tax=Dacryopinax primogenitus (strain DJM 731) TaxID=1858805 RepID=M5FNR6_DACPD|nr:uncharacterized protein DACRYDRAFT_119062 [Dacryopinax primogenitus]EJT97840.1 hypothetical protein DACRYDRAFT_119062 [Dacryopinax primogenitus]
MLRDASFLAVLLALQATAANIKGYIRPNEILKGSSAGLPYGKRSYSVDLSSRELSPATRVVLDGGRWSARVTKGGVWELQGIPEGEWVLDVLSPQYDFDQYLVRVPADPSQPLTLHPHTPFAPLSSAVHTLASPLYLSPTHSRAWQQVDSTFATQIRGMFGNPMMLLMIATVAGVVLVPMLLKNMDPEALEEGGKRREMIARGDVGNGLKGLLEEQGKRGPAEAVAAPSGGRPKGKGRRK